MTTLYFSPLHKLHIYMNGKIPNKQKTKERKIRFEEKLNMDFSETF